MARPLARTVFLGLTLASVVACGGSGSSVAAEGVGPGGHTVGATCAVDADCRSRCVRIGAYPGGMCTVSCRDDRDCPAGSECVDDAGGICALSCAAAADCSALGAAYTCDKTDRHGASGETYVCRAP